MGFVMLGIATLTPFGFNAAIFGMVAHGLITGMLFFVAGCVKERYHTLEIRRMCGMLKQAPRLGWILGFCAMASLGLPGLAGFWGEFPAILSAYSPVAGLNGGDLPRLHGHRRRRHGAGRRATCCGCTSAPRSASRRAEFAHDGHIHDVERPGVDRVDAAAHRHPRARRLPEPAVQGHEPGRRPWPCRRTASDAVIAAGPARPVAVARRSTTTRSRPRSSSPARSCVLLVADLFLPERQKWATSTIAGLGLLAAFVPILTLAVDGDDRVDVRRRLRRRQLRAGAEGAVPAGRLRRHPAVDQLHRGGRLLPGRVLLPAADARSSAW